MKERWAKRSFYVVSYDITDDRRRNRVHKLLTGFGEGVQYSVFECFLSDKELVQLRHRIRRLIKPQEDKVRIYSLCSPCLSRVEALGCDPPREPKAYVL